MTARRGLGLLTGVLLAVALAAGAAAWLDHRNTRFDRPIALSAAEYDLDFDLVKSVVFEESWFDPSIRGAAGEVGLMQITLAAAADFASRNGIPAIPARRLVEPELNIEIGCWYLHESLEKYRNSPLPELFALLRYNAGEARSSQWLKLAAATPPPAGADIEQHYLSLVDFPQTRDYVRNILQRRRSGRYWF